MESRNLQNRMYIGAMNRSWRLALPVALTAALDSLSANFSGGEGRGEVALRFMGSNRSNPAFTVAVGTARCAVRGDRVAKRYRKLASHAVAGVSPDIYLRPESLSENSEGCCFRAKSWMARRDEREYPPWVFDRGATKPGGFLLENPSAVACWAMAGKSGRGSFVCGPRWLGRHSPLRGYSSLAALPTPKIPRRNTPRNFQTGSEGTPDFHRPFRTVSFSHDQPGTACRANIPRRSATPAFAVAGISQSGWLPTLSRTTALQPALPKNRSTTSPRPSPPTPKAFGVGGEGVHSRRQFPRQRQEPASVSWGPSNNDIRGGARLCRALTLPSLGNLTARARRSLAPPTVTSRLTKCLDRLEEVGVRLRSDVILNRIVPAKEKVDRSMRFGELSRRDWFRRQQQPKSLPRETLSWGRGQGEGGQLPPSKRFQGLNKSLSIYATHCRH